MATNSKLPKSKLKLADADGSPAVIVPLIEMLNFLCKKIAALLEIGEALEALPNPASPMQPS